MAGSPGTVNTHGLLIGLLLLAVIGCFVYIYNLAADVKALQTSLTALPTDGLAIASLQQIQATNSATLTVDATTLATLQSSQASDEATVAALHDEVKKDESLVSTNYNTFEALVSQLTADETTLHNDTNTIQSLTGQLNGDETTIAANGNGIASLASRLSADESNITSNVTMVSSWNTRSAADEANISTNTNSVAAINAAMKLLPVNFIARGNPSRSNPMSLSDFATIHFYSYTTNSGSTNIDIPTVMGAPGIYEITFQAVTTGFNSVNCDLTLSPNFTTYSGAFLSTYMDTNGTSSPNIPGYDNQPNASGFYFDFYNGSAGTNPLGKITLYNYSIAAKAATISAGDTNGLAFGTSHWNDTTTAWNSVGNLSFSGYNYTSIYVWVRRTG